MAYPNPPNTNIQDLPRDMLSVIMSKVANHSIEDMQASIMSCPELADAADDFQVFRKLNLSPIVAAPLLAVTHHPQLVARCLAHSNPSAQYITGLLQYFHHNNYAQGIMHFHEAANGVEPVDEAVYLYGIIKLCTGEHEVGKQYLARLGNFASDFKGKNCWKNIRRSLHDIGHFERPEYLPSLLEMVPPPECNLNDMRTYCSKCYHYKKMFRFMFTM